MLGSLAVLVLGMATTGSPPRSELQAMLKDAPRLGLGMASLGRPGYINLGHAEDLPAERSVEQMREHAITVLDEALKLGLRYVDCARSYGLSEEFVASWLASRGEAAAGVVVGSKVCVLTCPRPCPVPAPAPISSMRMPRRTVGLRVHG